MTRCPAPSGALQAFSGGFHAQGIGVVPGGQLGAVQGVGPAKVELRHDGVAALACPLTQGSAGRDGGGHLIGAHGVVERAQGEPEVDVPAVLD